MPLLQKPDRALLERWLEEARVHCYVCEHCESLHITDLRSLEGVIDSRLLLEAFGLVLTTELEIRPMALLAVSADIGRLSMEYPTLKIFLDIVDDATPQLVVAGVFPCAAGLVPEQFASFTSLTMQASRQLAQECLGLDYLFSAEAATEPRPSSILH